MTLENRICTKCNLSKSIDKFVIASYVREGRRYKYSRYLCKDCDRERRYRQKLKQLFNLELETVNSMLDEQDGVCAICKQPEVIENCGYPIRLSVDHSHTNGKVRGLLCYRCNILLGKAEDSIELLQKAIIYLKKHA